MSKQSHLVGIAYVVAAVLFVFPLVDLGTNLWPWHVGQATWRYGSYGLLSGYVLTALLGLGLALGTAITAGHRRTSLILAALGGVAALLFLASTAIYGLDAIQLYGGVPENARAQFSIGTGKALFKNVFSALVLLWFTRAGWKAGRVIGAGEHKQARDRGKAATPLVSSGAG